MHHRKRVFITGLATVLAGWAAAPAGAGSLRLESIGLYETGVFDESAAEIVAYDPLSQQLFVTNANVGIDILDIADPTAPMKVGSIGVPANFDGINSVAVSNGVVAAAVEANGPQDPGSVFFYDTSGAFLNSVQVGVLPDMVAFTPDGQKLLVANEAEPDVDLDGDDQLQSFNGDAVGSVSIIDLSGGVGGATVNTVDFSAFNGQKAALEAEGAIFSLADAEDTSGTPTNATVAQDVEPEFIAVSPDGKTAFVALQENNAIAIIDVEAGTVTDVQGLGFKDHDQPDNGLDASNRDDAINIANWPALGAYAPDGMATYEVNGEVFLVTANEGDARDFDIARVKDLNLDPTAFPNADDLQEDENLGRLEASKTASDTDGDGDADRIVSFGARSFSIWKLTPTGLELVSDSGDQFEQLIAQFLPDDFNSTNDENDSFDNRSDDAGPEPEGVTIGTLNGRTYAFVGLERVGGVMVYDITDPLNPFFVEYDNQRDFLIEFDPDLYESLPAPDAQALLSSVGDLGPEGLLFISGADSPNGLDLLVLTNEVSGTTRIYAVVVPTPTAALAGLAGLALLAVRRRRRGY